MKFYDTLNHMGVVEKFNLDPPPFVGKQTVKINLPKRQNMNMSEFDWITHSFSNAIGPVPIVRRGPVSRPAPTTTPRTSITPSNPYSGPPIVQGPPISRPNTTIPPINRGPITSIQPPPIQVGPPVSSGGGGGGGGSESASEEKGGSGTAENVINHTFHYILGAIAGGGAGFFVAKRYKKNVYAGILIGASVVAGGLWTWYTQVPKWTAPKTAPAPAPTTTPAPNE